MTAGKPERLAVSAGGLQFHFAYLNNRLRVSVIRDIGHNLLGVRAKAHLKCFEGIELELADCQIGSRRARRSASDAMLNSHRFQSRPYELLNKWNVGLAVIRDVKMASLGIWIHEVTRIIDACLGFPCAGQFPR